MFHIFCGCPFLSLLFLSGIMLAMVTERRKLKRHSVPNVLCWRVMLFGLWMMFVPAFALLWLVSSARGPHGAIPYGSVQWLFLVLALLHGFILKPVFRKYERSALECSFNSVWGR